MFSRQPTPVTVLARRCTLMDEARPDEAIVLRIELVRGADGRPVPSQDPFEEWRIVYESDGARLTPAEERSVIRAHLDRLGGDIASAVGRRSAGRGRPRVTMTEARMAADAWHEPKKQPLSNMTLRSRRGSVADALGIAVRTADDRIADARRRGLLEPTELPAIDNEWSRRERNEGS